MRQRDNPQVLTTLLKSVEDWGDRLCDAIVSDLNLGRPGPPPPSIPAPRQASPVAVMDARPSRRTCRDGSVQAVRRSSSAAAAKPCSWSGYNGAQSVGFSSHRHERLPLDRVTAGDNQPSSRSDEERSNSAPSSRSNSATSSRSHSASSSRSNSVPSSRSSSPGALPSSRSGVPNFSRLFPRRTSTLSTVMGNRSAAGSVESLRSRLRSCNVKRWDPYWRTTTPWDRLRRVCSTFQAHPDM